jgi:putative peptidoglycan lipid II flippase
VLAPGFYAQQDIRTPVRIAIIVLVLTQVLNLLFVPWLGHAGLALSIGLAALVNATWLLIGLRRRGAYRPAPHWPAFAARVVAATALLGAGLWWASHAFDWIALRGQWQLRLALLAAVLGAAALVYFASLRLLGLRFKQFLKRT